MSRRPCLTKRRLFHEQRRESDAVVRPYYQIAQQVGIAALLMLIVAFFDRRRYRHLSKSPIMKKEASGPPVICPHRVDRLVC